MLSFSNFMNILISYYNYYIGEGSIVNNRSRSNIQCPTLQGGCI